ncbi:MAG TPA: PQQ-binding-like beta-propeller repeat protein [Dehalococcoidia bacterium]|nr:PQQ-binding-like beta-propeller repeat protein [Dehalococcoidia bacterium]
MPSRRFAPLLLAMLTLTGLAAAGCGRIARPDGWAAPLPAGDLVIAGRDDRLVALRDGAALWVFPAKEDRNAIRPVAFYGNPAPDRSGEYVYVPIYEKSVFRLRVADGAIAGRKETKGVVVGGVAVGDDAVYFGDGSGRVYAMTPDLSQERWTFEAEDRVWSTPVLVDGLVVVTSLDGKVYGLDEATGERRWVFEADAGIAGTPALASDRLFVPAMDSRLYALDAESGQALWSFTAGNWFWGTPVVQGGVVYAASLDGRVYALDAATGAERWRYDTGAPVRAAPALVEGSLVVANRAGRVVALDPANGSERREPVEVGERVLADVVPLDDGTALIATTKNRLVRFDPAEGVRASVDIPKDVGTPTAEATPTPEASPTAGQTGR